MTDQCQAVVYRRDTYRYTGGPKQFAMHYTRSQCRRHAKDDGLCWQHLQAQQDGVQISRWD